MKKNRNYLIFIAPAFILYSIFIVLPIIIVMFLGFTDWSGMGEINFVGIKNFVTIFTDSRFAPEFFNALKNNLKYLLCVWLIITPFQYLVAHLLFIKIPAHKYIKFMVFLPYVISTIIVSFFMSCLIFQKFFRTIPAALEESARLDGCSDLRLFFKIILPITKPVIFTMALITAIGEWNDFYMPMILLGNKNVTTLTLAIYRYVGQFTKYMSESMAAVVITLIPIIIIYFVFSSQIVEGLTGGAVKG